MAYLDANNRLEAASEWMREDFGEVNITKQEVLDAANALDTFLEDNRTAINNAIPEPARSNLTINQKIMLLQFILARRLEARSDG